MTFALPHLLLALGLTLLISSSARAESISLEGQLTRGATFSHALPNGLYFFLLPDEFGWNIVLSDTSYIEEAERVDLASFTFPLHGINATQIEGWHFRNRDNSGPNLPGPLNVNAPGERRDFTFVANRGALQRLRDFYDCQKTSASCTDPEMPYYAGRLDILSYDLTPVGSGLQAAFQAMTFRVTFSDQPEEPRP